jgi:hypothetical protein
MSEARNDATDDRTHQVAALGGAEGAKHRGSASREDVDATRHGKHRRPEGEE